MAAPSPLTLLSVFALLYAAACLSVGAWVWHDVTALERVRASSANAAGRFIATSSDGRGFEATTLTPAAFQAYRTTRSETENVVSYAGRWVMNHTVVVLRRGPLRALQMYGPGSEQVSPTGTGEIYFNLSAAGAVTVDGDMPEGGSVRVVEVFSLHNGGYRGTLGLIDDSSGVVSLWSNGPQSTSGPQYTSVAPFNSYQRARTYSVANYAQSWHVRPASGGV